MQIVGALATGAYSLLALLLTLFRPKLLFRGVVFLLLLPVAAALVVLPLSCLILRGRDPDRTHRRDNASFVRIRITPWDAGALGSSGTTLLIYEKPRFVPFNCRRNLTTVVFDDSEVCIC